MSPGCQRFRGLALILPILFMIGCGGNPSDVVDASFIHIPGPDSGDSAPKATWDSDSIDLGILAAGEVAEVQYVLTNTGRSPLVVTQVMPSCGCTVAKDWDQGTLGPGNSRTLTLTFDAGDRIGDVAEYATVVTNAFPSSSTLHFTARVMGPGSSTSTP